jgi:hypothetical protein
MRFDPLPGMMFKQDQRIVIPTQSSVLIREYFACHCATNQAHEKNCGPQITLIDTDNQKEDRVILFSLWE